MLVLYERCIVPLYLFRHCGEEFRQIDDRVFRLWEAHVPGLRVDGMILRCFQLEQNGVTHVGVDVAPLSIGGRLLGHWYAKKLTEIVYRRSHRRRHACRGRGLSRQKRLHARVQTARASRLRADSSLRYVRGLIIRAR